MLISLMTALAAIPTQGAGYLDVGDGRVERMSMSSDGELLLGRDRSTSTGFIVRVEDWSVTTLDPCAVSSLTSVPASTGHSIYVACDNGRIYGYRYAAGELTTLSTVPTAGYWQFSDDAGVAYTDALPVLVWDLSTTDPLLYAFRTGSASSTIHALQLNTNAQDTDVYESFPILASGSGLVEAAIDGGNLYIVHGGQDATIVGLATGLVSFQPISTGGTLFTVADITPGGTQLFAADTERNAIFRYNPLQGTYTTATMGFNAPTSLARYSGTNEEWVLVGGDSLEVHVLSAGVFGDITVPAWSDPAPASPVADLIARGDYSFAGTTDGQVRVISARPWIDAVAISPATGEVDTEISLSFDLSSAANWSVWRGGDRTGTGGTILATGTSTAAGTQTTTFTVNENWAEGVNRIYVTASQNTSQVGHARTEFTIDTVPDAPVLTPGGLRFSDNSLTVTFEGLVAADLASYDLYLHTEAFVPEDYATGGPVEAVQIDGVPGERVSYTFRGLENGTPYFIAVRAVDGGGLESPMSNVVSGSPTATQTASELAGEAGGPSCSHTGSTGLFTGALVGLLAAARRRRPTLAQARPWLLAPVALMIAGSATAQDKRVKYGDLSRQYGNFEFRYGPIFLQDDTINDVYDQGHEVIQAEFGPQITRFVEVDFQFGFFQELNFTQAPDGSPSDRRTMLTMFPLGVSATGRLQFVDEQLFVPHVRLGMDYIHYRELTDRPGAESGKDKVTGSKVGNHFAVGGSLLLDAIAPGRASLLEAQSGINDTYLVVEWRRQAVDARSTPWGAAVKDGFDFSGTMLTVGLKLDY